MAVSLIGAEGINFISILEKPTVSRIANDDFMVMVAINIDSLFVHQIT